ncbi:CFDP2, partial [Symbiodinium necroappetens]
MTAMQYDLTCDWLTRSCPYEVVVFTEIQWGLGRQDATWEIAGWAFVVTADPDNRYSGVAIAISSRVATASQITFCSWVPGRILHVKCEGQQVTLDIIGLYQWVKRDDHKLVNEARRSSFWTQLGRLLSKLPLRNLLVLLGDWNTPVEHLPGLVGRGVLRSATRGADEDLQQLLQVHRLVMLNTWGRAQASTAFTFQNGTVRSQIDFIAVRKEAADTIARRAAPSPLDLMPGKMGPRHRPVCDCIRQQGPALIELRQQVASIFRAYASFSRQWRALRAASRTERRQWLQEQIALAQDQVRIRTPEGHLLSLKQQYDSIYDYFATAFGPFDHAKLSRLDVRRQKFGSSNQMPQLIFSSASYMLRVPVVGLQDPAAKLLASAVKSRVQATVLPWLMQHPQFAYCKGKSLDEAITRAADHCKAVRDELKSAQVSVQARRWALVASLLHAKVEASLIDIIVAIHEGCTYHVTHAQHTGWAFNGAPHIILPSLTIIWFNGGSGLLIRVQGNVAKGHATFVCELPSLCASVFCAFCTPVAFVTEFVFSFTVLVSGAADARFVRAIARDPVHLTRRHMATTAEENQPTTAAQEMLSVLGLAKHAMTGNPEDPWARREPTASLEEDASRASKWPKQQSKGHTGKGQAWDQWRPHGQDWFQKDESTATVDQATQQVITALVKMAIRHEEELAKIRIDTTMIFYLDTGSAGILPLIRQMAEAWSTEFEAGKVTSPLKVVLLLGIFQEVSTRITSILQDEEKHQKALEWAWLQAGATALDPLWTYFQWNTTARKQEPSPLPPIKNSEVRKHLDYLTHHLSDANILTRFKATRRMSSTDRYASAVLPFFCALSLRGEIATACHTAIRALVNCSALKTVGLRIKPARGERQPLAAELEKAYLEVPYTQWQAREQSWKRTDRRAQREGGKASEGAEQGQQEMDAWLPQFRFGEWAARLTNPHVVTDSGSGPSIGMVIALQLPKGVYVEMLEEWLLLQAYSGLWREMGQDKLPPALSMAVRNDIIHAAVTALEPELCAVFLDYAERLQKELPRYAATSFPLPCALPSQPSSAECIAHALLGQGHGSLWTSARQVAAELSYHTVHRAIGTHLSFSVGAYGHRGFVGMLKQTGTHQSVCRLLNALVTQIYPAHVWTTVTVNVDLQAPTHIDVANASYASLLLGLSHFDDGTLWAENESGLLKELATHWGGFFALLGSFRFPPASAFPVGRSSCAFDVKASFRGANAEYPEDVASQRTGERYKYAYRVSLFQWCFYLHWNLAQSR